MSSQIHQELLRESELFRGLSEREYPDLLESGRKKKAEDGSFYFMEGDPASSIFVLLEGRVKLLQVTPEGQQVIFGYASIGDVFGIIAASDDNFYPVSAQAVGDCLALYWDKSTINRLIRELPVISENINRILLKKIQDYQNRIRESSTQRVERRIARTLLRLAQQTGKKVKEGVLIDLPLTRQDLAEMTGTTLFTVSRTLKAWESRGLVLSKREKVIVRYPHGLVTIAEDFQRD